MESFEGGKVRLTEAEFVSMGESSIKVPYDTPRLVGRGGINEDCPEVLSKGRVGRTIHTSDDKV